jgi:hypothetical protein
MSVYDSNLNLIGDVAPWAPFQGKPAIALGGVQLVGAARFAVAGPMQSSAANVLRNANIAPAALVVPTEKVAASGPEDSGGGIPKPILIGAGVAAVLAIGLVAFKLHKG